MTSCTVRRRFLLLVVFPGDRNKSRGPTFFHRRSIATDYLQVCFMWEMHRKLAGAVPPWSSTISDITQTRKQESQGIARRNRNVAIRTNPRRWSLAREELLPMAIETCLMLRKLSHIGKSSVAFANFLPVRSRKLVARITCQFLFGDVGSMGELRIVNAGLNASLCHGRNAAQNKANGHECCQS